MAKFQILAAFVFFSFTVNSQIHYNIIFGKGISKIDFVYFDKSPLEKSVKGNVNTTRVGLGVSSVHNGNLGIDLAYCKYQMPTSADYSLNGKDIRYQEKVNLRVYSTFKIYKFIHLRPFYSLNRYFTNHYTFNEREYSFEYGVALVFDSKFGNLELFVSNFPEYEDVLPFSEIDNYYRISAERSPLYGFNLNVYIDNPKLLKDFKQIADEKNKDKTRHVSIEGGMMTLLQGVGVKYEFNLKRTKLLVQEFGGRFGYKKDGANYGYLYYGIKYKFELKESNKLNFYGGFEGGLGLMHLEMSGLVDYIPYPHLRGFLEFEFYRTYYRIGAGTGFMAMVGYKF
jgi:hypothetical protein